MSLEKLLRKIRDDLFAAGISNRDLAKLLGTSEGTLSKNLRTVHTMSFNLFSKIVAFLYKDDYEKRKRLINEYLSYETKRTIRHEALEFAAIRGEYEILKMLVDKESTFTQKKDREWADVYQLILKKAKGSITRPGFLKDVEGLKKSCSTQEMKILTDVLWCQAMSQMHDFNFLLECVQEIKKRIADINNKFIRDSFYLRINEGIGYATLIRNHIAEARVLFENLLTICKADYIFCNSHARALWILGESYIFENYDKSREYLEKSLSILENLSSEEMAYKKQIVIDTLDFIRIYWWRDIDQLSENINDAEHAFYKAKLGEKEESLMLLDKLEKENGQLSPFQLCYKGIAMNDRSIVEESYSKFIESGNIFYSQLPKKVLEINRHMV